MTGRAASDRTTLHATFGPAAAPAAPPIASAARLIGALVGLALIGSLVLAADAGPPPVPRAAPDPETLRVAQYNVQFVTPWSFGTVSAKHWPNTAARAAAIGETLACFDLVALNETINDARRGEIFAAMQRAGGACGRPLLPDGRAFAVLAGPAAAAPSLARIGAFLTDDVALAWLGGEVAIASRLPVVASASRAYRAARGADALAAKGVLHARLWRGGRASQGDQLDLFVTHLQANDPDIREAQIEELAAFIRARSEPSLPAILMGDLNIDGSAAARRDPGAEYHRMIRQLAALGFRDPGQGLGGTDSWRRRRIDYMLLRSGQLTVPEMRAEQFNDLQVRALSDHAALTAELRWRAPPRLTAGR
ncbi:MAG TPA: endonuclease/exonuclease/phosphatase family protein [Geminicoccaceae bacterium]|nr:endonuclease/exonuclease/phosphatase family protein [Geminicoccaceae bacterium]